MNKTIPNASKKHFDYLPSDWELRKLEQLTASLAGRIETATDYVNRHTMSFSEAIEPLDTVFDVFDESESSIREDITSNERTEPTANNES